MKFEVLKEENIPLLSRKRIIGNIEFSGPTPSRDQLREAIAVRAKADKELVIIKKIDTVYGAVKAKVTAHVYKNKEDIPKIEPAHIVKRHQKNKAENKKE